MAFSKVGEVIGSCKGTRAYAEVWDRLETAGGLVEDFRDKGGVFEGVTKVSSRSMTRPSTP